jgi:lambda repressor-like predicted transcriptional regulator
MRPSIVEIIRGELKRREWSMSELDRQAGFSIGESRRFLAGERQLTTPKIEAILDALQLVVRRR